MSSDVMYISKKLVKSKAFLSLKRPGAAIQVYLLFLTKRVMKKNFGYYVIVNNGNIQFSYNEAERYGISSDGFKSAIDKLINVGLIDIAETSSGNKQVTTKYAISDRWKKFGELDFEKACRLKRLGKKGFQKGNTLGVNSK